ncbi:MAG TPA: NUDIX domain-containing protein [Candidatus Nanoarchaeia archaeon]|nr:NUDIX domain-containing protein [Candidatus Nanoarchaeia archaeon]
MVRQIMVVKRDVIFKDGVLEGFLPLENKDYLKRILQKYHYKERNDALENNTKFLQIIPYAWIVNKKEKKVFLYTRGTSKGEYQEVRHLDKYSGGIGGHIDKEEKEPVDPIMFALNREAREEVIMKEYPNFKFVGYVHGEQDVYEKVHLGIVAVGDTEDNVVPTDDGLKSGQFYSIDEVERLMERKDVEFDKWTIASWSAIKRYLLM